MPLFIFLVCTWRDELGGEHEVEVLSCTALSFSSQNDQELLSLCKVVKGVRTMASISQKKGVTAGTIVPCCTHLRAAPVLNYEVSFTCRDSLPFSYGVIFTGCQYVSGGLPDVSLIQYTG